MTLRFPLSAARLTAFSLCLLAAAAVRAADPMPLAAIKGELRTFSPDGRFAVIVAGDLVSVFETTGWKGRATFTLEGAVGRPQAAFVDGAGTVGVLHKVKGGQTAMELRRLDDQALGRLAREVGGEGRTLTFGDDGLLRVNGIACYFNGSSVAIRRKNGPNTEFLTYRILSYSCKVGQYLALAPKVAGKVAPQDAKAIRDGSGYGFSTPTFSTNAPAYVGVDQSDLAVSWSVSYTTNGSHPAHGDKPDVDESKSEFVKLAGAEPYEFESASPQARLKSISTPAYLLLRGDPWVVKVKGSTLPAFDLVQLGAPGFVPVRVSPDAGEVAFFNGRETRIYAASVVTDQYANLDPEVLQDVLMEKMMGALRQDRYADALPYFDRLTRLGRPLPESFYFYQADALEKSGRRPEARAKAEAYLAKYGKKGKFYTKIVALLARL